LQFRKFLVGDLEKVSEIYERDYSQDFSLPNLDHTIGNGIITSSSDRILGFGMVKCYPEAIIILDKTSSNRDKVNSLKLLYENAIRVCKDRNFNELRCHIIDDSYGQLLTKHFNFHNVDGKLMEVSI
jgi:hypothetical protein